MVSRLISWRFGRSRRRLARARGLSPWSPTSAIECLEERTLLSASLALYNGSFAGTYKGTETVNNNGKLSTVTESPAAVQASIVNGVVSVTIAGGTGNRNRRFQRRPQRHRQHHCRWPAGRRGFHGLRYCRQ